MEAGPDALDVDDEDGAVAAAEGQAIAIGRKGQNALLTSPLLGWRLDIEEFKAVGADPEGSIYSGDTPRPYLVEGIGEDFMPSTFDPSVVDRYVRVSDRDSFLTARAITRQEGILVGGSSGTAVFAALAIGRELDDPEATIVVLLPDSGRQYMSKLYSETWMLQHGMLERPDVVRVEEVLSAKSREIPPLITVSAHDKVRHTQT